MKKKKHEHLWQRARYSPSNFLEEKRENDTTGKKEGNLDTTGKASGPGLMLSSYPQNTHTDAVTYGRLVDDVTPPPPPPG
jgi:hypothetical protein